MVNALDMGNDKSGEFTNFVFNAMPLGVISLDLKMDMVYCNKQATLFLDRFELPDEITPIGKRIFDAINRSKFNELFPGEICLIKKLEGSSSTWIFRLSIFESLTPIIVIFIMEDKISNKLDVNAIRQLYRLTRRESDILRRVLDGLKNVEIAKELEIAEQTVKDHLSNIYSKLGVENRNALYRSLLSPSNIQF
jgi:DNA-binding CsgD family transcriptional regulator